MELLFTIPVVGPKSFGVVRISTGDSEGCNEMNESAALLRQFCAMFENAGNADKVRVYFPGFSRSNQSFDLCVGVPS